MAEKTKHGLTSSQAKELLEKYGPNTIHEPHHSVIRMFSKRLWGVIPWMLEASIILDIALGKLAEAGIITFILLFQAVLGAYNEKKTKAALVLLRKRLSINARVLRDGSWQTLPASELVPGDAIYLRVGDIVPADVLVFSGTVSADQSQLTGESLPVEIHDGGTLYSGSIIKYGEASSKVTATGKSTYFGKTIELTHLAKAPPRLQQLAVNIAKYLLMLDIVLALAVFTVTLIQGLPLLGMLPFVLILLVISVPALLPMMSMTSAMKGAGELVKSGVLTTQLPSIENAAAMNILCVDKTGTITENKLSVQEVEPFAKLSAKDVLRLAVLASDEATQDPIDLALLKAAQLQGIGKNLKSRVKFVPFDPATKCSEAVILTGNSKTSVIKGEPLVVAKMANADWADISDRVARLSSDGSRVIAIAEGRRSNLSMRGLIALADQPRSDSADFVKKLTDHGIRVVLVTGDGKATAHAIASKVGIEGGVAPLNTIKDGLDTDTVAHINVFSNVFPQEKFMLVKSLQKSGHIVGMTGDGVNDVPALAQADVGIAVADSTDAAKSAAGLVMTKQGLSEILIAVEVSRKIFQRLQSWVLAMITRKVGIPLFIALGTIFFMKLVMSPLQVVMYMFFAEIPTFMMSTDNVEPSKNPRKWEMKPLVITGVALAILLFAFNCIVFWLGIEYLHMPLDATQTFVFVWLVFAGAQAILYSTRTRNFFWSKPYPGRMLLYASIIDTALVTLVASQGWLMAAISTPYILGLLGLSIVFLVMSDIVKNAAFWLWSQYGKTPEKPLALAWLEI
jgi:H+-transporting ATPase